MPFDMLAENAKSPPQVQERNARDGPIPLFGADAIKFQLPEEEGGEMTPLFFRRADMRNAWLASGQDAASMPDAAPVMTPREVFSSDPSRVTDLSLRLWRSPTLLPRSPRPLGAAAPGTSKANALWFDPPPSVGTSVPCPKDILPILS